MIKQSFLKPQIKAFYQFHGIQLYANQYPISQSSIQNLYNKLRNQIYDGGQFFEILKNQQQQSYQLQAKQKLQPFQNIFIIDHFFSFRYIELKKILMSNPNNIVQRIKNMILFSKNNKKLENSVYQQIPSNHDLSIQLDNQNIIQLSQIKIQSNIICLSLKNNNIFNIQTIIDLLKKCKKLKGLWLNQTPIENNQQLELFVNQQTLIQIYNTGFTKNVSQWGTIAATVGFNLNLLQNIKPEQIKIQKVNCWQFINKFKNVKKLIINNNQFCQQSAKNLIYKIIPNLPNLKCLFCSNLFQQYLYKSNQKIPKFINKHDSSLKCISTFQQQNIQQICQDIWKLCGTYRLANRQKLDQTSVWYLNDQLGSSIQFSDVGNIKMIPFLYAPNNKMDDEVISYSIMWPIRKIQKEDKIYRDYLNGIKQINFRSSRLAVWFDLPKQIYIEKYLNFKQTCKNKKQQIYSENQNSTIKAIKNSFKLLTDNSLITQYLTLKQFQFTKNLQQTDIIWFDQSFGSQEQMKKFESNHYFTDYYHNQFPYQSCIVNKAQLNQLIQNYYGETKYFKPTFNLQKQLPLFLGQYFYNQKYVQDNYWILKPPNMARSMDMIITDNLKLIIRNMETGPKLAQKYIEKPLTLYNKKIDLRFIIGVRSIIPLKIFLYKHFWIRTANNNYNLDSRYTHIYQTHFTVMNYGPKIQHIKYPQFLQQLKLRKIDWDCIYEKIKKMVKQIFIAARMTHKQMNKQKSRSLYGLDVMIQQQNYQPIILQITFSPDCERACKFYPTFYNDIFEYLFLQRKGQNIIELFQN